MSKFIFTAIVYTLLGLGNSSFNIFPDQKSSSLFILTDSCFGSIPNAFSPNGDGVNDLFKVYSSCELKSFNMKIFSEQSELIYEMDHTSDAWDGKIGEIPSPEGRYVWRLTYFTVSGQRNLIGGDIVLVR